MTDTYAEDEKPSIKIAEELRLIRCLMERMLRLENEALFVDYEHEKFGIGYKTPPDPNSTFQG